MTPKLTPWLIARATRIMATPVVASFAFWQAYWETLDDVMWPQRK